MDKIKIEISQEIVKELSKISNVDIGENFELVHHDFYFLKTDESYEITNLYNLLNSNDKQIRTTAWNILNEKVYMYQQLLEKQLNK